MGMKVLDLRERDDLSILRARTPTTVEESSIIYLANFS